MASLIRLLRVSAALCALGSLVDAVDPLVDLGYTRLQGVAQAGGVTQWLGVRYAAPPVGDLRFAAPADPPNTTDVVDASNFQPICLARSPSDFTMKPNMRFNVSEDCLFLNVFAPSAASAASPRPVLFFIQGGGFESNSNANFNGSQLAAFGDMVVVQINYRVGPFGFLQSEEVLAGGSFNNGLKDQLKALEWTRRHIAAFGGDPQSTVAAGDSAGATSIALLLAAFADSDPGLFRGAILESGSTATLRTLDQGQEQYGCLVNATGCLGQVDTLACLRAADAGKLQTEKCQFNPHLDGDLVREPMLARFDAGRYLRVPVLAGSCADEGTKNVPRDTDSSEAALQFVNGQASEALSGPSLELVNKTYIAPQQPVFPGSGRFWRQLANADGDMRAHCVTARLQNAMARDGVATYSYRYAVRDPEQERLGFGAYHTVELNGVFGPDNTDGAPPKSYRTSNAAIVPATMAYWASFVSALDPSAGRLPGTPAWEPWTGPAGRQRLRFETNNTAMERMDDDQVANCEMLDPLLTAIESPPEGDSQVQLNRPGERSGTSWDLAEAASGTSTSGGRREGAGAKLASVAATLALGLFLWVR